MRTLAACTLFAWLLSSNGSAAPGGETLAAAGAPAMLHLADGQYAAGQLLDCDRPQILRWQAFAFAAPLEFSMSSASTVHFPLPPERPKPKGEYCFELQDGGLLFGTLRAISEREVLLEARALGLVHAQRAAVRRISRWRDGADLVYLGPNGLSEWSESSPPGAWRQEAGRPTTDQAGALLAGDFGIPLQAIVEVELSWASSPDFVLSLGVAGVKPEQAFRLEVWDRQLVFVRETAGDADLVPLQKIAQGPARFRFSAYLDQQRKRAIILSSEGRVVGDLRLADADPLLGRGIRLVHRRGSVRLEQLRITRWNGEPPRGIQADRPRLDRTDGSIEYGQIQPFDGPPQEYVVSDAGRTTRIPAEQIASVVFPQSAGLGPRAFRAVLQDGTRLSGDLRKVEGGRVWLDCPGISEPLGVPVADLQTLVVLAEPKPWSGAGGREGRLECDGLSLRGHLVDGNERNGESCLVWQSSGSSTASPLKRGVSGRIVYRAPRPPAPPQPMSNNVVAIPVAPHPAGGGGLLAPLMRVFTSGRAHPTAPTPSRSRPLGAALYLRSGDTIPCTIKRIDQHGVTLESSMSEVRMIAHDQVKAVDLENPSLATKIDVQKRDRLLTLPRMQRENPPTHLIRSTEGDYLRARLIEMDEESLTVEVRLETRRLPRNRVTRIIWLGAEPSGPDGKGSAASTPPRPSSTTRVQALRSDGSRLTFVAESLTGTALQGTSEVIGPCRVDLTSLDQLILGGAIEQAAGELPYRRWKLQRAIDPKFVSSDGQPGGAVGTESALVGKPAPDFELETLDGRQFHLSQHRGKIVVLDFWATWCGPCTQTLPQIDRAVRHYRDQGVVLLAVNLQETPETIQAMLKRLELEIPVGLDRSGIVAEKYAAVAIPQTVIIDRSGTVVRLFVGGGPQYADQIAEALKTALTPATGQPSPSQ